MAAVVAPLVMVGGAKYVYSSLSQRKEANDLSKGRYWTPRQSYVKASEYVHHPDIIADEIRGTGLELPYTGPLNLPQCKIEDSAGRWLNVYQKAHLY